MHDRPKSTSPNDWEEATGFRETSIVLLPPEHQDTLRRFGRMLYELTLAGDTYYGEPGESSVRREVQAALADLVHTRDFMAYVARQVEESALRGEDARLSLFAREIVGAVDRVIDALQEGLA